LGNIKKGWDIGWALGGWLERLGTKAKASKAKSTDGEILNLVTQVNQTFESTQHLSELKPYNIAASIVFQAAQNASVGLDNPLTDSMIDVVLKYIEYEGLYGVETDFATPITHADQVDLKNRLRHFIKLYGNEEEVLHVFVYFLAAVFETVFKSLPKICLPDVSEQLQGTLFDTHILNLTDDVYELTEEICVEFYHDDLKDVGLFNNMRDILQINGLLASGINPHDPDKYVVDFPPPTKKREMEPSQMVGAFFHNTPLKNLFLQKLPFAIPPEVRMEHMHVLAGSGHGKTQLLQKLILDDLNNDTGFAIIDSQGDLISKLLLCEKLSPDTNPEVFDKLMIVDASDVEFPTCLNLFALSKGIENLSLKDKEILANSTVDLYTYIFSSLLGAELTARQGTIFVYIAKLMMEIPDASIITLRQLMEDGKKFEKYMDKLQDSAKAFFKTQFFSKTFNQTKQQILYRLWAILSNSTLERMFSNTENKVDLYGAMNEGKIVLINTSKQVLGKVGSEVMGKFFIAMLTQSAMKRAAIHESERRDFHVYIDEAQEYVDDMFNQFLNQTRKYKVGFHLFHQNYDQLSATVRASILSSTSIKFAGGVSSKDARTLCDEMKTTPSQIMAVKKYDRSHSEYSLFVQNVTPSAVVVDVPFGLLESLPSMSAKNYEAIIENNRDRHCRHYSEVQLEAFETDFSEVDDKAEIVPVDEHRKPTSSKKLPVDEVIEHVEPTKDGDKTDLVSKPQNASRGSVKHKYLQALVQKLGGERGFLADMEYQVPSGDGYIDIVLRRDSLKVAFEISVTTPPEYEVKNLRKCLNAGYEHIALIAADGQYLKKISELADSELTRAELYKIDFLSDVLLSRYLDSFEVSKTSSEVKKMHGYEVNVSISKLSATELEAKQKMIDSILLNAKKD